MDLWYWLVSNAEGIAGLSTVVLTILTGVYVVFTWRLSQAALADRLPAVWADLEPVGGNGIRFVLGNDGPGGARNLKFEIEDSFNWQTGGKVGKGVTGLSALHNGIPYLAPRRTLKYDVGKVKLPNDAKKDTEQSIDIKITFDSDIQKRIKRHVTFDLSTYRGVLLKSFEDGA